MNLTLNLRLVKFICGVTGDDRSKCKYLDSTHITCLGYTCQSDQNKKYSSAQHKRQPDNFILIMFQWRQFELNENYQQFYAFSSPNRLEEQLNMTRYFLKLKLGLNRKSFSATYGSVSLVSWWCCWCDCWSCYLSQHPANLRYLQHVAIARADIGYWKCCFVEWLLYFSCVA